MNTLINRWAIKGLDAVNLNFQLYEFDAPPISDMEHTLKAAEKQLALSARDPVVQVKVGNRRVFAHLPGSSASLRDDVFVGPHQVTLRAVGSRRVRFPTSDQADLAMVAAALRFAVRGKLERSSKLWGSPGMAFERGAVGAEIGPEILALRGIKYRVTTWDLELGLVLDILHRYVARRTLCEMLVGDASIEVGGRRALYRYGRRWYVIDLNNILPTTVAEQVFRPPEQEATTVLNWTKENAGVCLDPTGRALLYKTPGGQHRYGATELAHLIVSTDVEAVGRDHNRSLQSPDARFAYAQEFIGEHLGYIRLGEAEVEVDTNPTQVQIHSLAVPKLEFGAGHTLDSARLGDGLRGFGRARERMLAEHGPAVGHSFGPQALLVPQDDIPRTVVEDFTRRLQKHVSTISGRDWKPIRALYSRKAGTKAQHDEMIKALHRAHFESGYCVAVLPSRCPEYLHHRLKADGWNELQFQCATADAVMSYYNGTGEVIRGKENKYDSYLRNLAYGILQLNRLWGWVLADSDPLRHDLVLGLDVLHNTAGLTILRRNGRDCRFIAARSKQGERLTSSDMFELLAKELDKDLRGSAQPNSVLLLRDGRTFDSERQGFDRAMQHLQNLRLLSDGLRAGIVEVHKSSATGLRLANSASGGYFNPPHGALYVPTESDAFVVTTGEPFLRQGTARPLHLSVAHGVLSLEDAAADAFALAHLGWSSPRVPTRLPVVISLCDEFLGPIATRAEEMEEDEGVDLVEAQV